MREIKFRAWDKKLKKMFEFELEWSKYVNHEEIQCLTPVGVGNPNVENIEKPSDLMQYTGLKDKNGKEIYEGDILNMTYHGSVSIVEPEIKVIVGFERGSFIIEENGISLGKIGRSLEVIGNIYENPELLESEK
jgi:uncharacterized phage protein (TIGR01671 family)